MKIRNDNWCEADKGKHFVLTNKGKNECESYKNKIVGEPVDEYDYEIPLWSVNKHYVEEVAIPCWTKLKGYQVVYYKNGFRLSAGNSQIFPTLKAAKVYKKHYEDYPWMDNKLFIEEVEYEGVPLSKSKTYNGKEVIDQEHYFGLDAHEIGSYFTEEMVMCFMDMLPPTCMRNDCCQLGESTSTRLNKDGNYYETYATFKKIAEDVWEYCGDCFKGENIQHGIKPTYI